MTSLAGYQPIFFMPVIGPPPTTWVDTATAYYMSLGVALTVSPSGVDEGLEVSVSPDSSGVLFAMAGGFVRCLPAGRPLPGSTEVAPAGGAILLDVWVADYLAQEQGFAAGVPPMKTVLYLGVQLAESETALRPQVNQMPRAVLAKSWADGNNGAAPPTGTTDDALAEAHLARVMDGSAAVFIDGGTAIGKAASAQSGSNTLGQFELRYLDGADGYVFPAPALAGAPTYD